MAAPRRLRVAIGGLEHETNTYATAVTGLTRRTDFRECSGSALVARHASARTPLGGFLAAAREVGADAVPCYFAIAEPSGIIEGSSFAAMKRALVGSIAAAAASGPLDGVALDLHGAGVAEGCDDIETEIGRAVRELVGPDVKIVCSLDLHGNIGDGMTRYFDAIVGYRLYPHEDMFETGHKAFSYLPGLCSGKLRLVTHIEPLPMLLPTNTTDKGFPHHELNVVCTDLEATTPGLHDVRVFHGFPWADVPRPTAVVYATVAVDSERGGRSEAAATMQAAACARRVAARLWGMRERFLQTSFSPAAAAAEAGRLALLPEGASGPVVVNECSDNTGAGAVGDATHLLGAMLEAGLGERFPGRVAFTIIFDPPFVRAAAAAGVGGRVTHNLGAGSSRAHGDPVRVAGGVVRALADGRCTLEKFAPGLEVSYGDTARVSFRGVEIVAVSRRLQTFDTTPLQMVGLDASAMAVIGLKSSMHFRAGFRELSNGHRPAIVTCDAPGLSSNNLAAFRRDRCGLAVWPLDGAVCYDAGEGGASKL